MFLVVTISKLLFRQSINEFPMRHRVFPLCPIIIKTLGKWRMAKSKHIALGKGGEVEGRRRKGGR